jgi:hypothetical protein
MTFREAVERMSKEENARACIYAMNTLLIDKGIYTADEFAALFCEHAQNHLNGFRPSSARGASHGPSLASS